MSLRDGYHGYKFKPFTTFNFLQPPWVYQYQWARDVQKRSVVYVVWVSKGRRAPTGKIPLNTVLILYRTL